jgi:hypothetical protein
MLFIKESIIRASPEKVFAFHELPDALARLTPPWENARVIEAAPHLNVRTAYVVPWKTGRADFDRPETKTLV